MSRDTTPFPHADIPDEPREPLITAALSAFTRDDPRYRRLPDHDANGLFHLGPEGEKDSLAQPMGYTHCNDAKPIPVNERKQQVTVRARFMEAARKWRADGEDESDPYLADKYRAALALVESPRHLVRSGYGLYGRPRKPANSGRKRKAA